MHSAFALLVTSILSNTKYASAAAEMYASGSARAAPQHPATCSISVIDPDPAFNVGIITGGQEAALDGDGVRATAKGKTNIIPGIAIARGDFRTLSQDQTSRVRAKMAAIVKDHAPLTSATIAFDEGYPPMAPTAAARASITSAGNPTSI